MRCAFRHKDQNPNRLLFFLILWLLIVFASCQNTASPSSEASNGDIPSEQNQPTSKDSLIKPNTSAIPARQYDPLPQWPEKQSPEKDKAYPYYEATRDPSLVAFRKSFYQAVMEKDLDFIKAHTAEDIKFSFGMDHGRTELFKNWGLDSLPQQSPFWEEMAGGEAFVYGKYLKYAIGYRVVLKKRGDDWTMVTFIAGD